jgi:hypothetical protein
MHDFNPQEMRPRALHFAGAANGGSFARLMPRSPFSDAEEKKLASDLLEVTNEAELEQVIGDLSKNARKGVESAGSKVNGPVEGLLKTVAKKALPSITAAVGASFDGPERDASAAKLGSLVNQALRAKVAGMTAADPELEKCRRLFEKYRQFVRLAGKATRAAATAPAGVAPVAAAQKILMDSAKETLKRRPLSAGLPRTFAEGLLGVAAMKPAVRASKFAEAAQAAAAAKTGAIGRAARRDTPKGPQPPAGHVCSICELPHGCCQCWKAGRTGRWFRDGTRIVVNC